MADGYVTKAWDGMARTRKGFHNEALIKDQGPATHLVTRSEPNVAKRPTSWLRGPLKIKGLTTGKRGQSDFETWGSAISLDPASQNG